jgi:hypothetical protein
MTLFGIAMRESPVERAPALWPGDRPYPGLKPMPYTFAGEHLREIKGTGGVKVEFRCPKCAHELEKSYVVKIRRDRLVAEIERLEAQGQSKGVLRIAGDGSIIPVRMLKPIPR